jgi:hypothetical protein
MTTSPPRVARAFTLLSMAVGALLVGSTAAHADPIALTNPGFEDVDLGPWATSGAIHAVTRDAPRTGDRALRLGLAGTGTAREEAGAYQDVTLTGSVATERNLRVTAAVAVDAALTGDATVAVKLEIYKKTNGSIVAEEATAAFDAPAEPGDWAMFEACATAPAGFEVFVRPVVTLTSASGKGTGAIRLDDVALVAGDDAVCATPVLADDGGCAGGPAAGWCGVLAVFALASRRRASR